MNNLLYVFFSIEDVIRLLFLYEFFDMLLNCIIGMVISNFFDFGIFVNLFLLLNLYFFLWLLVCFFNSFLLLYYGFF